MDLFSSLSVGINSCLNDPNLHLKPLINNVLRQDFATQVSAIADIITLSRKKHVLLYFRKEDSVDYLKSVVACMYTRRMTGICLDGSEVELMYNKDCLLLSTSLSANDINLVSVKVDKLKKPNASRLFNVHSSLNGQIGFLLYDWSSKHIIRFSNGWILSECQKLANFSIEAKTIISTIDLRWGFGLFMFFQAVLQNATIISVEPDFDHIAHISHQQRVDILVSESNHICRWIYSGSSRDELNFVNLTHLSTGLHVSNKVIGLIKSWSELYSNSTHCFIESSFHVSYPIGDGWNVPSTPAVDHTGYYLPPGQMAHFIGLLDPGMVKIVSIDYENPMNDSQIGKLLLECSFCDSQSWSVHHKGFLKTGKCGLLVPTQDDDGLVQLWMVGNVEDILLLSTDYGEHFEYFGRRSEKIFWLDSIMDYIISENSFIRSVTLFNIFQNHRYEIIAVFESRTHVADPANCSKIQKSCVSCGITAFAIVECSVDTLEWRKGKIAMQSDSILLVEHFSEELRICKKLDQCKIRQRYLNGDLQVIAALKDSLREDVINVRWEGLKGSLPNENGGLNQQLFIVPKKAHPEFVRFNTFNILEFLSRKYPQMLLFSWIRGKRVYHLSSKGAYCKVLGVAKALNFAGVEIGERVLVLNSGKSKLWIILACFALGVVPIVFERLQAGFAEIFDKLLARIRQYAVSKIILHKNQSTEWKRAQNMLRNEENLTDNKFKPIFITSRISSRQEFKFIPISGNIVSLQILSFSGELTMTLLSHQSIYEQMKSTSNCGSGAAEAAGATSFLCIGSNFYISAFYGLLNSKHSIFAEFISLPVLKSLKEQKVGSMFMSRRDWLKMTNIGVHQLPLYFMQSVNSIYIYTTIGKEFKVSCDTEFISRAYLNMSNVVLLKCHQGRIVTSISAFGPKESCLVSSEGLGFGQVQVIETSDEHLSCSHKDYGRKVCISSEGEMKISTCIVDDSNKLLPERMVGWVCGQIDHVEQKDGIEFHGRIYYNFRIHGFINGAKLYIVGVKHEISGKSFYSIVTELLIRRINGIDCW